MENIVLLILLFASVTGCLVLYHRVRQQTLASFGFEEDTEGNDQPIPPVSVPIRSGGQKSKSVGVKARASVHPPTGQQFSDSTDLLLLNTLQAPEPVHHQHHVSTHHDPSPAHHDHSSSSHDSSSYSHDSSPSYDSGGSDGGGGFDGGGD
jgi:uncharacterized membrane protein YgcG